MLLLLLLLAQTRALYVTGVNLAVMEFTPGALPGVYGVDYRLPPFDEIVYYAGAAANFSTFRLPFLWERLQPVAYGALDAPYLANISAFVANATGAGAHVILDVHNYARYYGDVVGESSVNASALADLWGRLALLFGPNPRVLFGLMNEPNTMTTEAWLGDANAALAAIRAANASNLVLVPGNAWTGAHSWSQDWYGTANAVAMLNVSDPGANFAFEVHQYLDAGFSGNSATCVSATVGSEALANFTGWARAHGYRAFLGEYAGGNNSLCQAAVTDMLAYVCANADVYLGWTWWAGGPWWGAYRFTLEPTGETAAPQLAWITPYTSCAATVAPTAAPTPPTSAPTAAPTQAPTPPTSAPTQVPLFTPTAAPTVEPTVAPTVAPTTAAPTIAPTTAAPTVAPTTVAPTTAAPTVAPTTAAPTVEPTTVAPTTAEPTAEPTTGAPTAAPTPGAPASAPTDAAIAIGAVMVAGGAALVLGYVASLAS